VRAGVALRTAAVRARTRTCLDIAEQLRTDPSFRAFHDGRDDRLPAYYRHVVDAKLGAYAELLDEGERRPVLEAPDGKP